jgi:hypothetical protein
VRPLLRRRARDRLRGLRGVPPNPGTYVSVDGAVKDRWQIPSATIHVRNHPADVENSRWLRDKGWRCCERPAPARPSRRAPARRRTCCQHGTCRFGTDPTTSVLDRFCRSHEVPNSLRRRRQLHADLRWRAVDVDDHGERVPRRRSPRAASPFAARNPS